MEDGPTRRYPVKNDGRRRRDVIPYNVIYSSSVAETAVKATHKTAEEVWRSGERGAARGMREMRRRERAGKQGEGDTLHGCRIHPPKTTGTKTIRCFFNIRHPASAREGERNRKRIETRRMPILLLSSDNEYCSCGRVWRKFPSVRRSFIASACIRRKPT